MVARNDITNAPIKTGVNSDEYRSEHERIFGKKVKKEETGSVAQSVEHRPVKAKVVGSKPI